MDELEVELLSTEGYLVSHPDNMDKLIRIADICLTLDKRSKSLQFLRRAMTLFIKAPTSCGEGMNIADLGLKFWKTGRYNSKDSLRVNISTERSRMLADTLKVLDVMRTMGDPALHQRIMFKIACVKEHVGMLQEAVAILSDLIAVQAMDGVDLTFIILKAAVLLKHLGNHDQAVEYLEFLLDDPPVSEGYGKTHILAFLALVYDQHPKRQDFVVVLRNTYDELLQSYSDDLAKGNKPMTNLKRIEKMLGSKSMAQSSEVWEMLSLQAIDRCEYIFGFELMQQAVDKAPGKYKLLHLMSETSYLLGYRDRAVHYAEAAFAIQPQSEELRTLLLIVAPSKWQDKLRNVAPSKSTTSKRVESDGPKTQKVADEEEEPGWFQKLRTEGPSALFSLSQSAEQKEKSAKIAAEKEKRKLIKQTRKEKKDATKAAEEERNAKKKGKSGAAKRDPMVDGPARPEKPLVTPETKRFIEIAREGKGLIHFYDPVLRKFSEARGPIERGERQWLSQQRAQKEANEKLK
jgi:tetratricopeptide (TPR) repeat protein